MEKKHHQLWQEQGGKKAELIKMARASPCQTEMERVALCFPKSTKCTLNILTVVTRTPETEAL